MSQATPAPAQTGHMKQYVFVDEYNRHKRLKVMRACDGCRKRKIRCDAALQNGPWPCGSCLRLKLKCAPPTLELADGQQGADSTADETADVRLDTANSDDSTDYTETTLLDQQPPHETLTGPRIVNLSGRPPVHFQTPFPSEPSRNDGGQHPAYLQMGVTDDEHFAARYPARSLQKMTRSQTELSGSSGDAHDVDTTVRVLSEQMGDLSIDETTVAPWATNEKKNLAEVPAVEEVEVLLPMSVTSDPTVRIPPEMMLSDARVIDYFGYYFNYIHPYMPVLNRAAFYEQWRTARHSISPLVLEGIFACVARYLEQPIEVQKWLALAARHEESFKDVPRLSTVQAMILLMKAKEYIPKRGYYYRSWMTVKYVINMACDLSLDEHFSAHRSGVPCKFSKTDCMLRTRIWQTLFCLELLVGAPQGRMDYSVEPRTVDGTVPSQCDDVDPYEQLTSRRYTYLTQIFHNIRRTNRQWQDLRVLKEDWALDPTFTQLNANLTGWTSTLPPDMQIQYPEDESAPWIGNDHFLAYMHCYQELGIIMHHRPQMHAMLKQKDPRFKVHLDTCLRSAALMCRVQEALIRDFGLHGLQFMLRGINFTIYCVLTCTMLHLAAITSPEPFQNEKARMYFTRHMRVLEHCIPSASGEMQAQINALREAFSDDTSKAFELKASLGLRSPTFDVHAGPKVTPQRSHSNLAQAIPMWQQQVQDAASSKTMSPASEYNSPLDRLPPNNLHTSRPSMSYPPPEVHSLSNATSIPSQAYHIPPEHQHSYPPIRTTSFDQHPTPIWDPSGIFNQWNTAFGAPQTPSQVQQQAPTPTLRMQPTHTPMALVAPQPTFFPAQTITGADLPLPSEPVVDVPTVTPVMWQDAFTNAYVSGHGQKRYRDEQVNGNFEQYVKRRG